MQEGHSFFTRFIHRFRRTPTLPNPHTLPTRGTHRKRATSPPGLFHSSCLRFLVSQIPRFPSDPYTQYAETQNDRGSVSSVRMMKSPAAP